MPRAVDGNKICSKCRIEKDVSNFFKLLKSVDGLNYSCKSCQIAHNDTRRDHLREIDKKSYDKNRKSRIAKSQKYNYLKIGKEVPERILDLLHHKDKPPTHEEVREREKKRFREYKASHKDVISQQNKKYLQTETGKKINVLKTQRYIARKSCLVSDLSKNDVSFLLEFQEGKCGCCQRVFSEDFRYEIDHIIPVVHGGGFTLKNAQLLCRSCNASKRDKTIRYIPELPVTGVIT